jgi:hypothetical protein
LKGSGRTNNLNHATAAMSATHLFSYRATLKNGNTISGLPLLKCNTIADALLLVNQMHESAEEITVTKLKSKNV